MSDKRCSERIGVQLRAVYLSAQAMFEGTICNLSRHGLFLRSDLLDESGGDITLQFELPGVGTVALAGEVVRASTRADLEARRRSGGYEPHPQFALLRCVPDPLRVRHLPGLSLPARIEEKGSIHHPSLAVGVPVAPASVRTKKWIMNR